MDRDRGHIAKVIIIYEMKIIVSHSEVYLVDPEQGDEKGFTG